MPSAVVVGLLAETTDGGADLTFAAAAGSSAHLADAPASSPFSCREQLVGTHPIGVPMRDGCDEQLVGPCLGGEYLKLVATSAAASRFARCVRHRGAARREPVWQTRQGCQLCAVADGR